MSEEITESKKTGGLGRKIYFREYENLLKPMIDPDSITGIDEAFDADRDSETIVEPQSQQQDNRETMMLFSDHSDTEFGADITEVAEVDSVQVTLVNIDVHEAPNEGTRNETVTPEQTVRDNHSAPQGARSGRNNVTTNQSLPVNLSRNNRTTCRTRNMDREQYMFDREQADRIHEAQEKQRQEHMQRLDAVISHLEVFNHNFSNNCINIQEITNYLREAVQNLVGIRQATEIANDIQREYCILTKLYREQKLLFLSKQPFLHDNSNHSGEKAPEDSGNVSLSEV
ncbi:uncharacterized protein [Hyperolius riggenbachi]